MPGPEMLSRLVYRRFPASAEAYRSTEQYRGKPDKYQLCTKDVQAAGAKKRADADRRNLYRTPGKEVARGVERREEGNSQTPIRDGVEHPM